MAANGTRVEIPGLADLKRDIGGMPEDVQKEFARQMKDVAEIVARAAARRVPSKTGNAIASLKSKGSTSGASVSEGGRDAPYMKWLDFGTRNPRSGNSRAEGPWRGSGAGPKGGRFIYPAIEAHRAEIIEAAGKAVDDAAKGAGFH